MKSVSGRAYDPHRLAVDVLRGVDRNTAVITAPRVTRVQARLARWAPATTLRVAAAMAADSAAFDRANHLFPSAYSV